MSTWLALTIAVALLGANAFFVAAEFALVSARRAGIQARAETAPKAAKATLNAMDRVSVMVAGAQLGITLCSLGLGALAEPAIAHLIEPLLTAAHIPDALTGPISFTAALTLVVFAHVVYGEMVPKNLTLANPEKAALLLSRPMALVVLLLKPFIVVLNTTANALLRLMRVTPRDEVASTFTRGEVAALLAQSRREGTIENDDADLAEGALSLTDAPVLRVTLPLDQLVTATPTSSVADIEQIASTSGFSRIPIQGPGNSLLGYIHLKDLLNSEPDTTATELLRPLAHIHAHDGLRDALDAMRTTGAHLGAVIDTQRVIGVATLEDILEELVGEIRDATHR